MSKKTVAVDAAREDTILIEVPFAAPKPEAYTSRHVEVGALSHEQATALQHIQNGLIERHVQLKSGRYVQGAADAVRYLLEQAYEGLPH
jgi:hypothetical protein